MNRHFVLGLLVLGATLFTSSSANEEEDEPSFYVQLMKEIKRQEQALQGKSIPQLAAQFIKDAKTIGNEVVTVFRDAMSVARGGEASSTPKKNNKDKSIVDLMTEILATSTAQQESAVDGVNKASRKKRDAPINAEIFSLLKQLLAAQQGDSDPHDRMDGAVTKQGGLSAANSGVSTRVGSPSPVVLIPGPPGKPGVPGVPGLPGKNGKIPNFRGLRAILTTRVAELLAYLAFMAVAMIGHFLGLLGLLLGLVLPVYGKLKNSGIVLPEDAVPERKKRSVLVDKAPSDRMVSYVLKNLENAHSKFL